MIPSRPNMKKMEVVNGLESLQSIRYDFIWRHVRSKNLFLIPVWYPSERKGGMKTEEMEEGGYASRP